MDDNGPTVGDFEEIDEMEQEPVYRRPALNTAGAPETSVSRIFEERRAEREQRTAAKEAAGKRKLERQASRQAAPPAAPKQRSTCRTPGATSHP